MRWQLSKSSARSHSEELRCAQAGVLGTQIADCHGCTNHYYRTFCFSDLSHLDAGSPMPSTLTSSEAQIAHFSGEDQDLGV